MHDGTEEIFTIRLRTRRVNAEMRTSFVGHHISATSSCAEAPSRSQPVGSSAARAFYEACSSQALIGGRVIVHTFSVRSDQCLARSDKCPPMGARKPGQGRVSGERSERNLDPVEHARTLSWRSEPLVVSTYRTSELVAAARSRAVPADPPSIRADDNASITTPRCAPRGAGCSRLTRATPP